MEMITCVQRWLRDPRFLLALAAGLIALSCSPENLAPPIRCIGSNPHTLSGLPSPGFS